MVRYYRQKAGMSRGAAAAAICKSESLIESIERGKRVATSLVTEDLDRVLNAGGDLIQLREEMGDGISCVEVAHDLPRVVAVRDSKNPDGPVLTVEPAGWRGFIADVKAGQHDLT